MTARSLAIRGGAPSDVVIVDGVISAEDPPPGSVELDAAGGFVVPGFVDVQVNGAHGIDLASQPDALAELAAVLPRYGVTAFCPTIVTSPPSVVAEALVAWRSMRPGGGAVPLGLHLEGPMLNARRRGAHDVGLLRPPAPEVIAGWSRDAGVALVTLAPELPGALDVVRELRCRGVVIAAGHTDATEAETVAGVDAGITAITHLFNAMRPFSHRDPGPIGVTLAGIGRLVAGLIVDGIHVSPTAVAAAWRALGPDRFMLVTDAVAALGLPTGPVRLGSLAAIAGPDGVRAADGTLAGSTLSMDRAVRNLIAFTGCSLEEAVVCASATPAALLRDASRGVLSPGRRGDVVVLDSTGAVVSTVVGGEVVWRS
jgi:N-acetylglucosamine-6-phosphate deacetylase